MMMVIEPLMPASPPVPESGTTVMFMLCAPRVIVPLRRKTQRPSAPLPEDTSILIAPNCYGSTVGGGYENLVTGNYATIPGGYTNVATNYAFAAGNYADATNQGAFVWSDSVNTNFYSINNNEFAARATGGVRFVSGLDGSGNPNAGVYLSPGGTSWGTISDRNAKKNFRAVDGEAVLEKLAGIPVEHWNYKWEKDSDAPNLGPMAQDFKHAFYPGRDDKSITTLEFDGVELAAIQGLNQKLHEKDAEIQTLKRQNDSLAERLTELEAAVKKIVGQK